MGRLRPDLFSAQGGAICPSTHRQSEWPDRLVCREGCVGKLRPRPPCALAVPPDAEYFEESKQTQQPREVLHGRITPCPLQKVFLIPVGYLSG